MYARDCPHSHLKVLLEHYARFIAPASVNRYHFLHSHAGYEHMRDCCEGKPDAVQHMQEANFSITADVQASLPRLPVKKCHHLSMSSPSMSSPLTLSIGIVRYAAAGRAPKPRATRFIDAKNDGARSELASSFTSNVIVRSGDGDSSQIPEFLVRAASNCLIFTRRKQASASVPKNSSNYRASAQPGMR